MEIALRRIARSKIERERLLVLAMLGVFFFCAAGGFLLFLMSTPPRASGPPLYPEPPTYAGATDVQATKGDELEVQASFRRERVIHFKTADGPQTVLSFYEDTFKEAGWKPFTKIDANEQGFYWTDGSALAELYETNITAKASNTGGTEVTVEMGYGTGDR